MPSHFSPEFELYITKLLIAVETGCTIPATGWPQMRESILHGMARTLGQDLPRVWPELAPRTESVRQRDSFTVEQVSAEFWPGRDVALQVYRPEGEGPFPGVVMVATGGPGPRHPLYQQLGGGLARMGILTVGTIALGKGARDTDQCAYVFNDIALLTGTSIAQEQTNTGRRALDYICSRPDVDASRIGITGDSDGGWTTLWTATADPRVTAAAPACTNYTFCDVLFAYYPWQELDAAEGLPPEALTYGANIPLTTACNAPKWFRFLNAYGETSRLHNIPTIDGAARAAYQHAGVPERYSSWLGDCAHGYWPVMQAEVIEWFHEVFYGERPAPGRITLGEMTGGAAPAGLTFPTLIIDGKPVGLALEDEPEFAAMQVAELPDDPGRRAFLPIIEAHREAARDARAALAADPARQREELRRCLGIVGLRAGRSIPPAGDETRLETEPGLTVAARWSGRPESPGGAVQLVVGAAADREAYAGTGLPCLDLELREEAALGRSLWALVLLNRPPLGMWVWDAIVAACWLRHQGYERVELVGVGEAGGIIAPFAGLLFGEIATVSLAGAPVLSLDEMVARHPTACRYWAHRLLWAADVPEAVEVLRWEGKWRE